MCHQTTAQGLGTPESYLGNFVLNDRREIYGPHQNPTTMPMQNQVMYTPTAADHMTSAAFCASCHTVITRPLNALGEVVGPEFNEQVTYLEWRNSDFRTEAPRGTSALSCQGCHMSTRDPDGMDISTRLSVVPPTLMPRTPIGRHTFVGANAYMLSLLAAERDWVGSASTPEELTVRAQNSPRRSSAARPPSPSRAPARMGDALTFNVRVSNTTGHRFPTGYPSRRAWLHVRVLDGDGNVRFEVGRTNALGRFVNGAGTLLEAQRDVVRPHLRTITADDQIQVWESVMVDVEGRVTHLPLRAARYIKDNRILSRGWRADHADAARTAAVGVEGDTDFRAGEDLVTRFTLNTAGWVPARVEAELLFQSISPDAAARRGAALAPRGRAVPPDDHRPPAAPPPRVERQRPRPLTARLTGARARRLLAPVDERFTLCRVEETTWVVTHPTGLSGYDFAFAPTFRVSHPARLDGEVTAIARMGAAADYGARYEALRALGIRLVHTPDTYRRTSLLPVWYPRIEGLTPRSLCFDAPPSAEEVGAALGWPVFVKGARQTSRHNKALCVAKTPAEFDAIMGAWRGDDILWWQPVVCREWAPLRRVAEPSSDLLPVAFEFRSFWYRGEFRGRRAVLGGARLQRSRRASERMRSRWARRRRGASGRRSSSSTSRSARTAAGSSSSATTARTRGTPGSTGWRCGSAWWRSTRRGGSAGRPTARSAGR